MGGGSAGVAAQRAEKVPEILDNQRIGTRQQRLRSELDPFVLGVTQFDVDSIGSAGRARPRGGVCAFVRGSGAFMPVSVSGKEATLSPFWARCSHRK